ncbi:MAG: AraC family transcriptional regulator [Lachnospiraceae bacterium]|nr:AraC family transcriptional regulator [Lachnospiraceae bacterium]
MTEYCSAFNPDSSETVAYNNPLFPAYARYGILSSYPDYSAISHWHRDLEFILIKKGCMTYNVNGELIELSEPSGIMVNSRQLHYGFSAQHNECEFICILLSPELLEGNTWFYQNYIERITENPSYPYLYLTPDGWQGRILTALEELYRSFDLFSQPMSVPEDSDSLYRTSNSDSIKPQSYFEVIKHFVDIMEVLSENLNLENPGRTEKSSDLISLRKMMTCIEEHYMEKMTLEDIAQSGTCCKSRCSLLFKKYLNDTPVIYTTKLRLRKSLTELLTSDKSMTEIACEYGFCTASYYCETFKKYYGMSPLAYRKAAGI